MRAGLIGFGLYELASGAMSAIGTEGLARLVGRSGVRDQPELVERATFELPLGLALLTAVQRRSWRPPVLALGSLNWMLRALSTTSAERRPKRRWPGALDRVTPAVGAGALGWLFSRAARAERWEMR